MQVVGEALFDALVEFESNLPRHSPLKEIHIVDISSTNVHSLKNVLYCKFRQFSQVDQ